MRDLVKALLAEVELQECHDLTNKEVITPAGNTKDAVVSLELLIHCLPRTNNSFVLIVREATRARIVRELRTEKKN